MSSYVILGATGFLGNQVRLAIKRSEPLARLVAVSRRQPKALDAATFDGSWCHMDFVQSDVADLVRLFDQHAPDVVINCVGRTTGSQEDLKAINTVFVETLVEALRRTAGVRLVHLGSAAEYGCQPEHRPIKETAVTRPVGDYGRTKLVATERIAELTSTGTISATVLRVFNAVGPFAPDHTLAGHAARQIQRALIDGGDIIRLGPLDSVRDFVATDDVVTAVLAVARRRTDEPIVNVGTGVATSSRAMVQMLADTAGFAGEISETSDGSARSTAVPWQQADVSLLEGQLDWIPTTPIAEALAALWQSRN